MKHRKALCTAIVMVILAGCFAGCFNDATRHHTPHIASWLAKKDALIAGGKPYDLVMTGWFTPEEAAQIRRHSPDAVLLAGLSLNWVWENEEWIAFLETVASYGHAAPLEITGQMYLQTPAGEKCAFGWQSDEWGHEEIYAMDPRDPGWVELITSFYRNALDQPQHDGIIVDMLSEHQWWCPDAIADEDWVSATRAIMTEIKKHNTAGKLVICNSGCRYEDSDAYSDFCDGFLLENFMGTQCGSTYQDGLQAAQADALILYGVDTDDTGVLDMKKMRLGLTLSLLHDTTWFTYDVGPRDHGDAWWFPEYDVDLGAARGTWYQQDGAYFREFAHGTVVSAPAGPVTVTFPAPCRDISTGNSAREFTVEEGDGRIFLTGT